MEKTDWTYPKPGDTEAIRKEALKFGAEAMEKADTAVKNALAQSEIFIESAKKAADKAIASYEKQVAEEVRKEAESIINPEN